METKLRDWKAKKPSANLVDCVYSIRFPSGLFKLSPEPLFFIKGLRSILDHHCNGENWLVLPGKRIHQLIRLQTPLECECVKTFGPSIDLFLVRSVWSIIVYHGCWICFTIWRSWLKAILMSKKYSEFKCQSGKMWICMASVEKCQPLCSFLFL